MKQLAIALCLMLVAGFCFAELNAIGKARTLEPNRIDAQTTGKLSVMPESTYTSAVLWLEFSYDDGSNFYGLISDNADGIVTNANNQPVWSTNVGGSIACDGTDDHISADWCAINLAGSSNFTVSFWAKALTPSTNRASFMLSDAAGTASTLLVIYPHDINGVISAGMRVYYNGAVVLTEVGIIRNGTWDMFTFVNEGANQRGYVNGVLT